MWTILQELGHLIRSTVEVLAQTNRSQSFHLSMQDKTINQVLFCACQAQTTFIKDPRWVSKWLVDSNVWLVWAVDLSQFLRAMLAFNSSILFGGCRVFRFKKVYLIENMHTCSECLTWSTFYIYIRYADIASSSLKNQYVLFVKPLKIFGFV